MRVIHRRRRLLWERLMWIVINRCDLFLFSFFISLFPSSHPELTKIGICLRSSKFLGSICFFCMVYGVFMYICVHVFPTPSSSSQMVDRDPIPKTRPSLPPLSFYFLSRLFFFPLHKYSLDIQVQNIYMVEKVACTCISLFNIYIREKMYMIEGD